MPAIHEARYSEGLSRYRIGDSLHTVAQAAFELKDSADGDEGPSLFVGYFEGLIADIRKIAAALP